MGGHEIMIDDSYIEWVGEGYSNVKWRCKICGETGDNLNFGATISNIEQHFKTHVEDMK
jgi:hypothetical protein